MGGGSSLGHCLWEVLKSRGLKSLQRGNFRVHQIFSSFQHFATRFQHFSTRDVHIASSLARAASRYAFRRASASAEKRNLVAGVQLSSPGSWTKMASHALRTVPRLALANWFGDMHRTVDQPREILIAGLFCLIVEQGAQGRQCDCHTYVLAHAEISQGENPLEGEIRGKFKFQHFSAPCNTISALPRRDPRGATEAGSE